MEVYLAVFWSILSKHVDRRDADYAAGAVSEVSMDVLILFSTRLLESIVTNTYLS